MITPTNPTVASNTYVGWGRTNAIANLGNYFNEYYLGWMYYDNIPTMFHATEFLTSESTLIARDITSKANAPVAYITAPDELNTIRATYYGDFTVNKIGNTPCYLNGIYAQSVNMRYDDGSVTSVDGFGIAVYREYGNSESLGTYQERVLITGRTLGLTNFSLLLDFLRGDSNVTFTVSIGGQNVEMTLNVVDLAEGYTTITGTQNGVFYRAVIGIYQYGISTGFTVDPDATGQGRHYQILPTLKMSSINGDYWVTSQSGLYGGLVFDLDSKTFFDNFQIKMGTIGYYGGFNFTLQLSQLTAIMSKPWAFVVTGNTILNREDRYPQYWTVQRFYTPSEVLHHFALCIRICKEYNSPFYGYTENSWCPEVLDDGEFTGNLLTGNLTEDDVQPWQWTNINVNTFTEDDVPEYEPPSPEPGDDKGSNNGSVLRPTTLGVGGTNGFITQYSLTAAQIAEIGRLLWYKFSDASAVEQYVKNYMFFTVSTTGTLNLSNLLDYFVSLRVYPFPLINVPSHASAGQDMWIGAGIVPLTFSTNLHTINDYADYIDAGYCTIPRYYNDFRDFAHTQIMLYLPYCGTVQLNPADVVGSTLHAQYAVDFATGGVTAYVDCTTWDGSQFVIAVLTGSIGADIPLTASNAAQIAARIAGDALNFAGTVGEAVSADVGRSAQAIGSAATGDVVGAAIGVANTYAGRIGGALDVAQTGLQIATAEGVKMPMLSGGRGFGSFGAPQTAYVQIRRGIYAEGQQPPQGFKEAYGEAYSKPVQVSSCTGFTVFANVDTLGLQCDAMEREQVKKRRNTHRESVLLPVPQP